MVVTKTGGEKNVSTGEKNVSTGDKNVSTGDKNDSSGDIFIPLFRKGEEW